MVDGVDWAGQYPMLWVELERIVFDLAFLPDRTIGHLARELKRRRVRVSGEGRKVLRRAWASLYAEAKREVEKFRARLASGPVEVAIQ